MMNSEFEQNKTWVGPELVELDVKETLKRDFFQEDFAQTLNEAIGPS